MKQELYSVFHDLRHLLSCNSIASLTKTAGEFLFSDIVIFNSTFQVLDFYTSDATTNESFIPAKESYLSPNTDYFPTLCNAYEKSMNLNNSTVLKNVPNLHYSICKTIFVNDTILGYIWILVPADQYDDRYIYMAETMAISSIRLLQHQASFGSDASVLLSELLIGKKIPEAITQQWLTRLNWHIDAYTYVIVIRNPVGKFLPPDILSYFDIRDSDRAILFNGDLVWIINQSKRLQGFDIERIKPLNKRLIELNLYAGLSRRCPNITHTYTSYKQAICAVEKCIYDQNDALHILPYIDTWIDDLLGEIYDKVDLKKYCTPQLTALEKYDKEKNSDLLKTLICYYDHNQSVKETAEYMFLHRNTVKYRLNKCEEILETDLTNMSRNIGIYFSLKVINFLQNNPRK